MRATASFSSGFCAVDEESGTKFVDIGRMTAIPIEVAHIIAGTVDDWEEIEGSSREDILKTVRSAYSRLRIVANIETCLSGISSKLQLSLMEEVEDLLKTVDNHGFIASMLMRAPLVNTTTIDSLSTTCLAEGFAASAKLLDRIRELQPHIRRLVDIWFSISDNLFSPLPGGRQQAWRAAAANGVLPKTIDSSSFFDVQQSWASLAFHTPNPGERMCFAKVGKEIASKLFPGYKPEVEEAADETEIQPKERFHRPVDSRAIFEKTMKQIEAITKAVSLGYDRRARKFLTELVKAQLAYGEGEDFAVKSLCNVAQQCADMFRTDFEYECLNSAIKIKPGDSWTLIQLGDHYKRVGRFDDAIKVLRGVTTHEDIAIVRSSLADVYTRMRKFPEAMELYEAIPGGEQHPAVRGAIADALRHQGLLEKAYDSYEQIIEDGLATDRVFAGMAEIEKRRGNLPKARKLYEDLLSDATLDSKSRFVYKMAYAQVLVRDGEFSAAYKKLDEAVQERPFSRQAWAFRAAVSGLLGNAGKAVSDLPNLGQTRAFNEWVSEYIRGLLLLMLDRYTDARIALFKNITSRLLDKDASEIVRLGAAVSFLRTKAGVEDAARIIERIPEIEDSFSELIRIALRYHIAAALKHKEEIARLRAQLDAVVDKDLRSLVIAIDQGHWKEAWELEVRSLLRLAA